MASVQNGEISNGGRLSSSSTLPTQASTTSGNESRRASWRNNKEDSTSVEAIKEADIGLSVPTHHPQHGLLEPIMHEPTREAIPPDAAAARRLYVWSFWTATSNMTATILGAGTLAIPYALKCGGIVWGLCILFCILLISFYTVRLLIKSADQAYVTSAEVFRSYEQLAMVTLGEAGVYVVTIAFVCGGFGLLMANLLVISESILSFVTGKPCQPGYLLDCTLVCVAFLLVLPLSLLKDIRMLRWTSFASVCTTMYITAFVLAAVYHRSRDDSVAFPSADTVIYAPPNRNLFFSISILVSSFSCHISALPVYEKLKPKNPRVMEGTAAIALMLAMLIYCAIGLGGYLCFGADTQDNVLNNWYATGRSTWALRVASLCIGATLTAACPIVLWPLRSTLISIIQMNCREERRTHMGSGIGRWPCRLSWTVVTVAVIALATIATIVFPFLRVALSIVGSIGGAFIVFIFPALFWLKLSPDRWYHIRNLSAVLLIPAGAALGCTSLLVVLKRLGIGSALSAVDVHFLDALSQ
ncbi:unnamed protein product [Vitrella brassicaformis CCMP3155]|uniref:Amino acid transporter transmembrane domain-containing protein n=1 Tax=Vitrella brassicaformis (strain CCMP3155) TaxID=1169540 RepID=A0A0G4EYC2_VITBC|nr:unnamed protein product [Vitrella brassicaformis CCMP3155]|eukprot:CEM04351.1 unnamed protein product [Vitrella brassicaformis CCMP3155]